eukprot:203354_1
MEPHILLATCFNITISIISGLFVVNSTYIFYKLSRYHVSMVIARRSKSVLLVGLCLSLGLLIGFPIISLMNNVTHVDASLPFAHFMLHCTSLAMPYIVLFRTYLIFYDIKCSQALQDQKWRNHIETDSQQKTDFFIRYRTYFGDSVIVASMLSCSWVLFASFGTLCLILNKSDTVIIIASLFVSFSLLLSVSLLLPKFDVIWKIRDEMHRVSIVTIFSIVSTVISFIMDTEPGSLVNILSITVHILIYSLIWYYSFPWMFKQFHIP